MTQRSAVFSCLGLGDGLIALVLAHNLHLNGHAVTLFHPFLQSLQHWFPSVLIRPFPPIEELKTFDRFFILFEKSTWMQAILNHCLTHFPERTTVLNPIATPRRDYPFWEGGRFDGNRPFVDNLFHFCKDSLRFSVVTKSNGIHIPEGVQPHRFDKRVVIHPCSSREGKNWPKSKYLSLVKRLKACGYEPCFILTSEERKGWELSSEEAPTFQDLEEMAAFVCESGAMIGNDSGIGHLASCLGLSTVTICRSIQAARFWRPAWGVGEVVTPHSWIPNVKGLRLRDRYWKQWISVGRVIRQLSALQI